MTKHNKAGDSGWVQEKAFIDLVNNKKGSITEIFWIIPEVQNQRKHFSKGRFQHIPRFCNVMLML